MPGSITIADLKTALPAHLRSSVNQGMADRLNDLSTTPEVAENIRNNMISYGHVIREGKFRVDDYLSAAAYVSFKLMGCNNAESYKRTFPDRYQILAQRGATDKEISSYVAAYSKGKLVNLVMEQTLVPCWVLNQDIHQRAINVQAELMMTANSEKVRAEAANSLLTHLKKPESRQMTIDLDMKENSAVTDLRDMLTALAQTQQGSIQQGIPTSAIAKQKLNAKAAKDITPIEDAEEVAENESKHTTPDHTKKLKYSEQNPRESIFGKKPLTSFVPE